MLFWCGAGGVELLPRVDERTVFAKETVTIRLQLNGKYEVVHRGRDEGGEVKGLVAEFLRPEEGQLRLLRSRYKKMKGVGRRLVKRKRALGGQRKV